MKYIGRFAPSPSGPLHFGSLIAALGSYFQARAENGTWLVRMEDLDPPREMPGAADLILKTLEAYQLHWDGEVLYQSQRHHAYQAQIEQWLSTGQAYYCECTRKQIKQSGGYYTGHCRTSALTQGAIRLTMSQPVSEFHDVRHGSIAIPQAMIDEDFIIKRRDGLFAYNLAVVLDDIDQGVTQVVRGADLIEPTGRQISLYRILGKPEVSYLHLPLALDSNGNKLSKQNHATAIDNSNPTPTVLLAMQYLGFTIPKDIAESSLRDILDWGIVQWRVNQLPDTLAFTPRFSNDSV